MQSSVQMFNTNILNAQISEKGISNRMFKWDQTEVTFHRKYVLIGFDQTQLTVHRKRY